MGLAWCTLPRSVSQGAPARFPWHRLVLLGVGVRCVAGSGQVAWLWLRLMFVAAGIVLMGLTFRLDALAVTRLFPSWPLSLHHPVGTAYWMFFWLDVTSIQVTVFLPLVVQVLHGVSPLTAGLGQGLSMATVASAATWVYGLCTLVPVVLTMLALRLLWLHRRPRIPSGLAAPRTSPNVP